MHGVVQESCQRPICQKVTKLLMKVLIVCILSRGWSSGWSSVWMMHARTLPNPDLSEGNKGCQQVIDCVHSALKSGQVACHMVWSSGVGQVGLIVLSPIICWEATKVVKEGTDCMHSLLNSGQVVMVKWLVFKCHHSQPLIWCGIVQQRRQRPV